MLDVSVIVQDFGNVVLDLALRDDGAAVLRAHADFGGVEDKFDPLPAMMGNRQFIRRVCACGQADLNNVLMTSMRTLRAVQHVAAAAYVTCVGP
jgi:hypothetical protein